jgi:glucose-1-phosphate adenylyltransferase
LLASGSIVTGGSVTASVLAYQARVDRAEVTASVLLPGAQIEPGCRLNQVIVDEDLVLPPGTEIGYDIEADRARFDVTENGAVLVTRDRVAALGAGD